MNRFFVTICTLVLAFAFASCENNINPDNGNDNGNNEPKDTLVTLEPKLSQWEGAWAMTSTHTMIWEMDASTGKLTSSIVKKPFKVEITVTSLEGDMVVISGFSGIESYFTGVGKYNPETKTLGILAGETLGKADEQGYVAMWTGWFTDPDGNIIGYDNTKYEAYTMTMYSNNADEIIANSTSYTVTEKINGVDVLCTMKAMEVYGFKQGSSAPKVYTGLRENFPVFSHAGDLTWTKIQ